MQHTYDLTIDGKPHTVRIETDHDPINPRTEWDNLFTFAGFNHRHYLIGDEQMETPEDATELARMMRSEGAIWFTPVYMYDHSGLAFSLSPFSCRWDSGTCGVMYVTRKQIKAMMGEDWKRVSKKRAARLFAWASEELRVYDDYHSGNVYGFMLKNEEGDEVDACWGFFGHDIKTNGILDCLPDEARNQILEKLK